MKMMFRKPNRIEPQGFPIRRLLDDRVQTARAVRAIGGAQGRQVKDSVAHR
jgi:hypothetical protein